MFSTTNVSGLRIQRLISRKHDLLICDYIRKLIPNQLTRIINTLIIFRSYSFVKNIPILLIQRVDSRRVKKLESKFIGTSRTSDKIPETKVGNECLAVIAYSVNALVKLVSNR